MNSPLIVSPTIYGLHEDYRGTVGQPLHIADHDMPPCALGTTDDHGYVTLQDNGEVFAVPVMYTVPAWDASAYDALNY